MRISLVDNLLVDNVFLLESEEERRSRERVSLDLAPRYTVEPNLGLLSLAAAVEAAGHVPSIFWPVVGLQRGELTLDPSLYAACADRVLAGNPDVVGLTTMACSVLFTMRLAAELKARSPDLPIVLGGPHASILHRSILERYRQIDVVVRHEAEETFPLVLSRLESRSFADIPGVSWRSRGMVRATAGAPTITDLDALPFPAYHLFPFEDINANGLSVEAGRGCPFACTFCSTNTFFGRKYRVKSAERLVADLDRLNARYGVKHFSLQHDLFTVDARKIYAFCEAVRGRGYGWSCSARVDCVDDALLAAMAEAGCDGIFFGVETGSPRMQRITKKKLKLELLDPVLRTTERLGISATTAFIIGFPEEEQEDVDATLDCIQRCASFSHVNAFMSVLAPEPGTALLTDSGGQILYDGEFGNFNASVLMEGDEQIIQGDPEMFTPYYYLPMKLSRAQIVRISRVHRILLRLSRPTNQYMLRFFAGSLARFMSEFDAWADAGGLAAAVAPTTIVAFLAHKLGEDHHLLSLLHYELDTYYVRVPGKLVTSADPDEGKRDHSLTRAYRLAPRAVLYPSLHNCIELWTKIQALADPNETLANALAGPRSPFVALGMSRRGGWVDLFAVEPLTLALLEKLRTPHSHDELRELAPELDPGPELFGELVDLGLLIAVQETDRRGRSRLPSREPRQELSA